jgi:hypothetical protein
MFNIDSFQKWPELNDFIVFSIRIYNNFHYTESEEKRMSDLMLTFMTEHHQSFRPEPDPHKYDAAPQHWLN